MSIRKNLKENSGQEHKTLLSELEGSCGNKPQGFLTLRYGLFIQQPVNQVVLSDAVIVDKQVVHGFLKARTVLRLVDEHIVLLVQAQTPLNIGVQGVIVV